MTMAKITQTGMKRIVERAVNVAFEIKNGLENDLSNPQTSQEWIKNEGKLDAYKAVWQMMNGDAILIKIDAEM